MFTILIRYNKTRRECLSEAKSVEYVLPGHALEPGLLVHYDDEHSWFLSKTDEGDEDWRDVFIMNSDGQTVARYTL